MTSLKITLLSGLVEMKSRKTDVRSAVFLGAMVQPEQEHDAS